MNSQQVQASPEGVGIRIRALADFAAFENELLAWLRRHGLLAHCRWDRFHTPAGPVCRVRLGTRAFERLCPGFDTLGLRARLAHEGGDDDALMAETLVALLAAPVRIDFDSIEALQSHLRVRRHAALAAQKTALAFKTDAAERPQAFWREEPEVGFVLQEGASLIDALVAATQPERTGKLYDFSCYRATEYVILLAIAQEARQFAPELYAQLEEGSRSRCIKSGLFHEVFLVEYGTAPAPVPMRYYVPGDRVWFKNPDEPSSNAMGYEGSWVIYMGNGLFSNFWKRNSPYTLERKCLEIYHWRDGARLDAEGAVCMDEARVDAAVARSAGDAAMSARIMARMMRYRDPSRVYLDGGCIDATREFPRAVDFSASGIRLPDEMQPA